MPLSRVYQSLRSGRAVSIIPTSGGLGPLVRGFINDQISSGVAAIRSLRNYRTLYGDISGSRFLDQFSRQLFERDYSERVKNLPFDQVPGPGTILESEFKVPQRYRFRVALGMFNEDTGQQLEQFVSIYSSSLFQRQEIEQMAMQQFADFVADKSGILLTQGFTLSSAQLNLVEHNFGSI
tara:strand:+ start:1525 stop:2064 length:540 start_codon:yes stop_codon:yes gene_type:complete